ncbi:type II toxin-antitoxin system Phd/YefM family antitoxin [Scytonema sp. NUACC26]|uniref:type II toxin-antitoxin system Phd/YefM family antitoxin n=1 Tax=Scytonema sp. NUACC26 TaxID=3140176 RepID=UPI0034DBCD40
MLEVDITDTSVTVNQLLNQIDNGEEVMIIRHGKPIARLSPMSSTPRPLSSRRELRSTQPQTSTSNLEIIQSLRQEARY